MRHKKKLKEVEKIWLAKIEREYNNSKAKGERSGKKNAWKGGNINKRPVIDFDDKDNSDMNSVKKNNEKND